MDKKPVVMIVGAGYAGKRFIQAFSFLQKNKPDAFDFHGVVDINEKNLENLPAHLKTETDLEVALEKWKPDIVAVCVNEYKHYEVLDILSRSSVTGILCEKPLTETLTQAVDVKAKLGECAISLNLVERFSPVVAACKKWQEENPSITIRRAEFFWGKHRMRDPRPSIGVCSEAIHPIDMIRYLFNGRNLQVKSSIGVVSDMQSGTSPVMDSVAMLSEMDGFPVIGQSSFAWPERDRRVVAFASDDKNLYRIRLEFDTPYWDCDNLKIVKINSETGEKETVFEYETRNSDFPEEIRQIYKVYRFIEESLKGFVGEKTDVSLVDIDEAIRLQEILEALAQEAETTATRLLDE